MTGMAIRSRSCKPVLLVALGRVVPVQVDVAAVDPEDREIFGAVVVVSGISQMSIDLVARALPRRMITRVVAACDTSATLCVA
jgi:hypothetical protein